MINDMIGYKLKALEKKPTVQVATFMILFMRAMMNTKASYLIRMGSKTKRCKCLRMRHSS